ncbi:MAG: helix-hairpin-helix domain-containing protein [Blastocatellia bacterium]|nr:helix-hairpin-helix domain-containing protein [Blastocatellia bacterium]
MLCSCKYRHTRSYVVIHLFVFLCIAVFAVGCGKAAVGEQSTSVDTPVSASGAVNINTASAAELEKLNGVGPALARRIIEHREKFGAFKRTTHLMLVPGISEARFLKMEAMLAVE